MAVNAQVKMVKDQIGAENHAFATAEPCYSKVARKVKMLYVLFDTH